MMIIRNVFIRLEKILKDHVTLKTGVITGIIDIFKYIKIEHGYFKLH